MALLALTLVASQWAAGPPPDWKPAGAPPPTAWALAGARSWRVCDEIGRKALQTRLVRSGASSLNDTTWRRRVGRCPGEPEVLVLAAQEQILESARPGWMPGADGTGAVSLDELIQTHNTALAGAVEWIDLAIKESKRRGEQAPFEATYLRAYANMARGRYVDAAADLEAVQRSGEVERWRIERMAAVAALLRGGSLDDALVLALGAVVDAPPDDTNISRYIWALVLDRSGAPASANATLRELRSDPGHTRARQAVESFLPIHERLYLRALEHQAVGEKTNAVRLWDSYLARPEPVDADRQLAQRHKDEL